ncbi:MAG: hypothetical protein ACHQIM_08875 [Sphingobacteriales bacterium]
MKITTVILAFLLFVIIIALPPAALQYADNTSLLTTGFWTMFIFMSVFTFLVLMLMLVVKQKNHEYFTQAFLGGTTLKILAFLIFIFLFGAKNAANKHVFLLDFIYIYLLNTAFEIYILLRNLRPENLR